MSSRSSTGFLASHALVPLVTLTLVSVAAYAITWFVDFGPDGPPPWRLWTEPGAITTLVSFGEVVVGVLAIAITVVAILVELAANRYTPRITELFVSDPVHSTVMGFFVVTSVVVVWVDLSLHATPHPQAMALLASALVSASLLAILPYFAYVFDFLSPTRVIQRIQLAGSSRLDRLARSPRNVEGARVGVARAVDQLGDIALNSVDKKDKPLTLSAVAALAAIATRAIAVKSRLPAPWFDTSHLAQIDQDFIALHPDTVRALTERRTWVEMKVLRQFQEVFGEAVNRVRDVCHLIAIHTRGVAMAALAAGDRPTVALAIRFLNTYMRNAINARDVRTAYNLMNEYRLLGERALAAGDGALVLEVGGHIQFYGQLAFHANLAFLLETAAYDLCALVETTARSDDDLQDRLLAIVIDVDREPEGGRSQEASLRGVRKAQVKLATHYLALGDERRARRIFDDMRGEDPERLRSIRAELERVEAAEYWEVSDRGINFEWLPPERRLYLDRFYAWFGQAEGTVTA
jgi:hypothetical protein